MGAKTRLQKASPFATASSKFTPKTVMTIKGVYRPDLLENLYPPTDNFDENPEENPEEPEDQQEDQQEDHQTIDSQSSNGAPEENPNDRIEIIRTTQQEPVQQDTVVEQLEGTLQPVQQETVVDQLEGTLQDNIQSIAHTIKANLDNEINDFNRINSDIDRTLENIQSNSEVDTPERRTQRPVERFTPAFAQVSTANKICMEELTFAQVMSKVFQQMSLQKGIKKFGDLAVEGMKKNCDRCICATVSYQETGTA